MSKRIIIAQSDQIPAEVEALIELGNVVCTADLTDEQSDALMSKLLVDIEAAR